MKREIYLLNNLGGKHSLVMKCDKIMYDTEEKSLSNNSTKHVTSKLVTDPFLFS